MTVREIALKLLLDYEESGKYVNLSLSSHLADSLKAEERAQLTSLLYTAVEHKLTYDYIIAALTGRSIDKLSQHTRNILRLGLCQIMHIASVPDFAAVNESVKLAKNKGERAIVNATLRTAVREKGSLPMPNKEKNAARYYSVFYSLPLATVKHFMKELGEEECVRLLEAMSAPPPTTLTVNTMRTTPEKLLEKLIKEGYNATRAKFSPVSLCVYGSFDPRRAAGFSEGEFFIQDEASCLPPLVLSLSDGEVMVDTCSAPGGKSLSSAILSSDKAQIHAFDLHESKLSLIEGSLARLGLSSVKVAERDATTPDEALFEKADKVLCDVPCSGLGVIAKKPDLRYKDITASAELPTLQLSILEASAKYLKRGGTLVYSTCTLNKAENADVVNAFLRNNPEFYTEDFEVASLKSSGGMLTLYPHIHNTDGFFVAKLRKK